MSEEEKKAREELFSKVRDELGNNDLTTLRSLGESDEADEKIMQKFINLQLDFYWKDKNPALVELVTREAMSWSFGLFGNTGDMLQSPLMYNYGSFTLPWWSDSLELTHEQQEYGLELASKLVELREHHQAPTDKIAGAKWLLAGQYLYLDKNKSKAETLYNEAIEMTHQSDEKSSKFMVACSYEGLGRTELLLGDKSTSQMAFKEAFSIYKELSDDYNLGEMKTFLLANGIEEYELETLGY